MKTQVGRIGGNRRLHAVAGIALACASLFAVQRAAGADLIANGDMETQSGGRPYGWGGAGEALEENGNHFLRLVQTTAGEMPMVYRRFDLPKNLAAYDQIDFSMRGRVSGLVKGSESWYDARVMINVKSSSGDTLASANISFGKDTGWSERHSYVKLVEGAAYVEYMPTLFRCNAGTFDFDDFHATLREPTVGLVAPTTEGLGVADALHVEGNRLVNAAGKHVWLQGVNVPSMGWSVKGENTTTSFQVAIEEWGASIIRLPLHSKFWFGDSASDGGIGYRQRVDNLINEANGRGCYVLVDLHEYEKATANHAAFWHSCATRYANRPGVLFDLLNEPHDTTWEVWHDGMQMLVDAVRATGAKNVVVCGGLDWGYDLSGVLKGYALSDTLGNGIMYSAHVYPWKGNWQGKFLDIAAQHPVLIGEVGCQVDPMPFEPYAKDPYEWAPKILACIKENKLNWTAWCFHPTASPCAISDWNFTPTPYWGEFVKAALLEAAEEEEPDTGTETGEGNGTNQDVVDETRYAWNPEVEEGDWSDPKNWIVESTNIEHPTYPNSAKCHAYFRNLTKPVRVRITESVQVDYLCPWANVDVTLYREPSKEEVRMQIWGTWWDQTKNAKFTVDGKIYYYSHDTKYIAAGAYLKFANGATYETSTETPLHGDGATIEVCGGSTYLQSNWALSIRGTGTRFILDDSTFRAKREIYLARNTDGKGCTIDIRGAAPHVDCPGVIAGRDGAPSVSPKIVFTVPAGGYAQAPFYREKGNFLWTNDHNAGLMTEISVDPESPFLMAKGAESTTLVDYPNGSVHGENIVSAALSGGREIASTATTLMIRQLIEVPAPTLGLGSTSTGAFSLSVGNAVRGATYQVYRTTSLAKPFEPWGAVVEAKADGILDFAVETDGSPSAFFKVEPVK